MLAYYTAFNAGMKCTLIYSAAINHTKMTKKAFTAKGYISMEQQL